MKAMSRIFLRESGSNIWT